MHRIHANKRDIHSSFFIAGALTLFFNFYASHHRSQPLPAQSWISDHTDKEEMEKHAKIDDPCPKCNHPELYFYTMQTRSVDEGSTVFYECPKCTHKFSQNN